MPESFPSSNVVRISFRDITIATAIVTCHKIILFDADIVYMNESSL